LFDCQCLFGGFRFNHALANQVIEHPALDLILLIAKLHDLRGCRGVHLARRNRLSGDGGDGFIRRMLYTGTHGALLRLRV
jgi:hypothetical protein